MTGYFCEFNTLGELWTARISSHIPLKDAPGYLSIERIEQASELIYRSLANGVAAPKVAIAAFNPHGGDGGSCGREEVDIIEPAVRRLRRPTRRSTAVPRRHDLPEGAGRRLPGDRHDVPRPGADRDQAARLAA